MNRPNYPKQRPYDNGNSNKTIYTYREQGRRAASKLFLRGWTPEMINRKAAKLAVKAISDGAYLILRAMRDFAAKEDFASIGLDAADVPVNGISRKVVMTISGYASVGEPNDE